MGAEEIKVGSAVIEIKGRLDGLSDAVEEGKGKLGELTEAGKIAGEVFEGIFAVKITESIKGLVQDGMAEFEDMDRSLSLATANVERFGGAYDGLREKVEEYSRAQTLSTQFSNVEVTNNLNELITRTHNLSEATYVNNLAMDLAAGKNKSLSEEAQKLELALTGDSRGVMQLSRELGLSRDAGYSAMELFAMVEKQFGGVAKAQSDAKTEGVELRHNWGLLTEDIAENLAPALKNTRELISGIVTEWRRWLGDDGSIGKEHVERIEQLHRQIQELQASESQANVTRTKGVQDYSLQIQDLQEKLKYGAESERAETQKKLDYYQSLKADVSDTNRVQMGAHQLEIKALEDEILKEQGLLKALEDKGRLVDENGKKTTLRDMLYKDELKDLNADLAEYDKQEAERKKKQMEIDDLEAKATGRLERDEFKEKADHWRQLIELEKKFGETAAKEVTSDMTTFFDSVKKGTKDLGGTFEELGKSMEKAVLKAIAASMEQYSAFDFTAATIALISEDYYDAGIDFAKGSAWAAAAGGVNSIANGLAKGGFATGGRTDRDTIPVNIRKEELVVPLDDPKAVNAMKDALGGGSGGDITIQELHINAADGRPETARSHAVMLFDTLTQLKARGGDRAQRPRF